jgi:hypothetical protein
MIPLAVVLHVLPAVFWDFHLLFFASLPGTRSLGPLHEVAALQPAARGREPRGL